MSDPRLRNFKTGVVKLQKDGENHIGVSIGGGSPHCPLLYIVQIFDNGSAHKTGVLEPGDEIYSVNGCNCRGWGRQDLAKFIQSSKTELIVGYKKFECNLVDGKSVDISLKMLKHRFIENVSNDTADNLGLSRAVLANDILALKVKELEKTAKLLKNIKSEFTNHINKIKSLGIVFKDFGDTFAEIACHESNETAYRSFNLVSRSNLDFYCFTNELVSKMLPILDKLGTFVSKAIPDTKLTLEKYLKAKFEYLSHCLKARETEEEDTDISFDDSVLERISTGNYEYRLQLRCRYLARLKFNKSKTDLLEKLELLDQKNVYQIVEILQQFAAANTTYFKSCIEQASMQHFSIEVTESLNGI